MSRGFHLLSNGIPGSVVPDGKCLLSPAKASFPPYSCHGDCKLFHGASVLKHFPIASFACKASSSMNHRRNPDFSRQPKGSPRGRSRQFRDRENSENFEDVDPMPSKNGPVLSLSSNPRYQATATPGRREKEIVELFRKVQAQLRARAAIKEEKKMEASQQGQGEKGTVDSLLKLLRKHSLDQTKHFDEEQNPNFLRDSVQIQHPDPVTSNRPASNFRRKSPVPRLKFQPVFSVEEDGSSVSFLKSRENKQDPEPDSFDEPNEVFLEDPVFLDDPSEILDTDEETITSPTGSADLSSLKLVELRSLAKSRGMKGYSKLKKRELIELMLSADGA